MGWQKGEGGIWFDDFDGAERVFLGMARAFKKIGKEHGSVYAVCKVTLPQHLTGRGSAENMVREAWKTLRFEFPRLSVIAEGMQKIYKSPTPEDVEDWADETFQVETRLSTGEIVPSLHQRRLPCLFFLPLQSEIIFHCSHWRIDALGTCMILDRFFDILSHGDTSLRSTPWEVEHENLSPSLEDAFNCPTGSTPQMEALAETIKQRNFEESYPSAGLPFRGDTTTPPECHATRTLTFTKEATVHLVAACKALSISITAAVHAACAGIVFELSHGDNAGYSTVVSVNVRDYLRPPFGTKQHACTTYVTGINHRVRRIDDFATRTAQLTKAYRSDWGGVEYMSALRPIYRVHGEALQAMATSSATQPASNVTVSSLGLVENYLSSNHGELTVDSFRLGSAIMGRQPTLYIWTFRGEMTLSVDFNEAYYQAREIDNLLSGIQKCLESELEIRLEARELVEVHRSAVNGHS